MTGARCPRVDGRGTGALASAAVPPEPGTDRRLTYRDAGVDIDAGDALVERIKPLAARTMRREVLGARRHEHHRPL